MKCILIELPTWLGDTVMTTPAIENLIRYFGEVEITLIGSSVSIEALKNHPKVINSYVIESNLITLFRSLKKLKDFDVFISFRSSFRASFIKFCISSNIKLQYNKNLFKSGHQVERYNNFINTSLSINSIAEELKLFNNSKKNIRKKKLLGICPGASYGNAKRWYPKNFADVAINLSNHYDIFIFGSNKEKDIAEDIESYLLKYGVSNYQNLVTKTNINNLIDHIANLDILITGDSGPMHIAAALKIPTVTIFGPTNHKETSQWMNDKSVIIRKNLDCQPCMKRVCPLKHHNCMKLVKSQEVLEAVYMLD